MKFKYTGPDTGIPKIPFDLILLGVFPRPGKDKKTGKILKEDCLSNGQIIEIPDDHPQKEKIIKGLNAWGHFEQVKGRGRPAANTQIEKESE